MSARTLPPLGCRALLVALAAFIPAACSLFPQQPAVTPVTVAGHSATTEPPTPLPTRTIPPTAADTPTPTVVPYESQIVYLSSCAGSQVLNRVKPDGSDKTRLTSVSVERQEPFISWSPDGGRFAFESGHNGSYDIFILELDGGTPERITNGAGDEKFPAWSPDGRLIAYGSANALYLYELETAETTLAVELDPPEAVVQGLSWSPDTRFITFMAVAPGHPSVIHAYDMSGEFSPDGPFITQPGGDDGLAVWSPIEVLLGYVSASVGRDQYDLWTIDPGHAAAPVRLTQHLSGDPFYFAWSPDGQVLAYSIRARATGIWDLYRVDRGGSEPLRLTQHEVSSGPYYRGNVFPTWSPDGSQIAFQSTRDGDGEIYIMHADGSEMMNLSAESSCEDTQPSWRPSGG